MDEDAAVCESVRQMGDAVQVGAELDRVHRPKPAWNMFALTALLALVGLFIKLFLTYDSDLPLQPLYNAAAILLGTGCLLGAYLLDFTIIGKRPLLVYFGPVLTVVLLCFIPGQPKLNGQYYYVEYMLLLFPLAFAALLYRLRGRRYAGLLLSLAGMLPLFYGCLLVPSAVGFALTVLSALTLMLAAAAGDWFAIGRTRSLILIGGTVLTAAVLLWLLIARYFVPGYFIQRVAAAFNPWSDPLGAGWQGIVVRELVSGGHFIGRGATGPYSTNVPDFSAMDTDFLLTWLIHNVGWIAFIIVMAVFAAFLFCGFRLCFKQKNMLGRAVSLAVMLTLALQTLFYVASNLGFILFSSILPLVSYGNTATVVNMALIGVMLSAFRTGSLVKDRPLERRASASRLRWQDGEPGHHAAVRRMRWQDGELTISFKRRIEL
jgi:cell division protein FtsW (lipid II flippase)